jgi:hypothetical protein
MTSLALTNTLLVKSCIGFRQGSNKVLVVPGRWPFWDVVGVRCCQYHVGGAFGVLNGWLQQSGLCNGSAV